MGKFLASVFKELMPLEMLIPLSFNIFIDFSLRRPLFCMAIFNVLIVGCFGRINQKEGNKKTRLVYSDGFMKYFSSYINTNSPESKHAYDDDGLKLKT